MVRVGRAQTAHEELVLPIILYGALFFRYSGETIQVLFSILVGAGLARRR